MFVRLGTAAALTLSAGQAFGQSFNVDFDGTVGGGAGVPASNFGAAAGQVGTWNSIKTTSPTVVTLTGLNGAASTVTMTRSLNGTFSQYNNTNTSAGWEDLLDDYQTYTGGTMTFTFSGLDDGDYIIYTYAAHPQFSGDQSTVNIPQPGAYGQPTQYTGGTIPVNGFKVGATHAVHSKHIGLGGPLTVNIADSLYGPAVISGIQIVKVTDKLRIHVNDNAVGNNDGSTWTNAMTDLQDALSTARRVGGPQAEVWVATGFYEPTTGTDRSATFDIPSGLEFLGGFNGTETTLAERTYPLGNLTYLTGAIGGSSQSDNSYVVVTLNNVDSNTLVDGFYIARGNNNGGGLYDGHGAGLTAYYAIGGMVRNCNFVSNISESDGGAVYLKDSSMRFINCTFYQNQATNGAGGAIVNTGPITTTLTLQNSRFLGNESMAGGAVYLLYTYGEFANCFFSGNHSNTTGGAIYAAGDAQYLKLWNCTVSKNTATNSVGGVYVSTGSDAELRNSIVWGNTANNGTTEQQQITTVSAHGSFLTKTFSNVQGIDADPKMADADGADNIAGNFDDDCRLMQGSPCIDAADASVLPMDVGDIDGDGVWNEALPYDLDSKTRRVEIPAAPNTGPGASPVIDRGCYEFQLTQYCYANCDNSLIAPVLNVNDFSCFMNKFAAGDAYANCDGSTSAPTLNVNDFSCFLNKFAAGCP